MQEYRREKNTVEGQLKEMRKKTRYHDEHLRVIDLWFKQLIDEVKTMIPDAMENNDDCSSIPSSLLFADSETFEKHLQNRSRDIQSVMIKLFGNNLEASTTGLAQVRRLPSAHQLVWSSDTPVVSQYWRFQPPSELKYARGEDRLESASYRYMVAEKKLDRAKSTTVAKLEKQALLGAQKSSEEDGGPVRREESMSNGVTENGDAIAELEESHNKALSVSHKQKEQIEKLEAENLKLMTRLTELTAKATRLTDDDYANTDLFKQLKSQHEDVIKRVNNLEALNIQLQEEAVRLQGERTSYKSQLESESQAAITEKDALLSAAETHLARIRSNRDELLADQAIRKSSQDQERSSIAKIKELAAAHESYQVPGAGERKTHVSSRGTKSGVRGCRWFERSRTRRAISRIGSQVQYAEQRACINVNCISKGFKGCKPKDL